MNLLDRYFACPKCDKRLDRLDGGSGWKYGDERIYQRVECSCGFIYREVFTFSHNETIDTGEMLDEEGNNTHGIALDY